MQSPLLVTSLWPGYTSLIRNKCSVCVPKHLLAASRFQGIQRWQILDNLRNELRPQYAAGESISVSSCEALFLFPVDLRWRFWWHAQFQITVTVRMRFLTHHLRLEACATKPYHLSSTPPIFETWKRPRRAAHLHWVIRGWFRCFSDDSGAP